MSNDFGNSNDIDVGGDFKFLIEKSSFSRSSDSRKNQAVAAGDTFQQEREYTWEFALLLYGKKEGEEKALIVFPDAITRNKLRKHPLISDDIDINISAPNGTYAIARLTTENADKLQELIAQKSKKISVFENIDLEAKEALFEGIKRAFKEIGNLKKEHIKAGKKSGEKRKPSDETIMASFVLTDENLAEIYRKVKMPEISVVEQKIVPRYKPSSPQKPTSNDLWDETLIKQLKSAGATIEVNPNGQAKLRAKNQDGGRLTIELDTDTHKLLSGFGLKEIREVATQKRATPVSSSILKIAQISGDDGTKYYSFVRKNGHEINEFSEVIQQITGLNAAKITAYKNNPALVEKLGDSDSHNPLIHDGQTKKRYAVFAIPEGLASILISGDNVTDLGVVESKKLGEALKNGKSLYSK